MSIGYKHSGANDSMQTYIKIQHSGTANKNKTGQTPAICKTATIRIPCVNKTGAFAGPS